jgi:hypothetical protein
LSKIVVYGQALFEGFPFKAFTRDIWLICLSNVIGAFGEGVRAIDFDRWIRMMECSTGIIRGLTLFV